MEIKRPDTLFFIGTLLVVLGVTLFLFVPYINAIILALTFAIVFQPLYRRVLKAVKNRKGIAAGLSIAVVAILVILPLVYFSYQVIQETTQLLGQSDSGYLMTLQNTLNQKVPGFSVDLNQKLRELGGWIVQNLGNIFSSISYFALILFISLFALFYLLRDGDEIREGFINISPLPNEYSRKILDKLELAVNSVVKGTLVVALVQGFLAGLGMAIFGVPQSVFWGSVSVIASMIPMLGSAIILLPASLFLIATNHFVAGIGLLLWSLLVVGTIDNVLRPFVVDKGINVHPFLILLSVVGGIDMFGLMGFLIGPLVLSFLFALLEIYPQIMGKSK